MAENGIPVMKGWVSRHYKMDSSCFGDGGGSGSIGAMSNGDLHSLSLSMSLGHSLVVSLHLRFLMAVVNLWPLKQRREGSAWLVISILFIGNLLIHLGKGHHNTEVFQGVDGLVDMKPIYGTIVARKKSRPEREGKFI